MNVGRDIVITLLSKLRAVESRRGGDEGVRCNGLRPAEALQLCGILICRYRDTDVVVAA